jgi:hypothetical protein
MKKITLGAAVAAALLSSGAQAALPVIDNTNTLTLYISGATAAANFIDRLVTSTLVDPVDKICDSSAPIWRFRDVPNTEQFAIYCKANNTGAVGVRNPSLPTGPANANLLIYKRNTGGSGAGVTPVAQNTPLTFLNLSSGCVENTTAAVGVLGVATCSNINNSQIPEVGLSDVDPIQFKGDNAIGGVDITQTDVDKLTVKSASALVFGAPVTTSLFRVLQAAQISIGDLPATCVVDSRTEACLPSLSSDAIASIHAGGVLDWDAIKVGNSATAPGLYTWALTQPALANDLPGDPAMHVCRRENGSGTQATNNIKFLGTGCTEASAAIPPAPGNDADFGEGEGVALIHAMSSSGRVDACMDDLQNGNDTAANFSNTYGKRWAIGLQSLEKTRATYEFVKIDDVAPTLNNVVEGKYQDWVENTFQYRKAGASVNALAGAKLTLADAIIKSAGAPGVMADLNNSFPHGFGNGAYLAVPSNHAPSNGRFDSARPVVPFTHAVRTGATSFVPANACRRPTNWGGAPWKL